MKKSTLRVRSKALSVPKFMAEEIRDSRTTIILPLLSKNIISVGDYFYLKELNNNVLTTKETALTFIEITSCKVVNIQELTNDDIQKLNVPDIKEYYAKILNDMVENTLKNKVSVNKLLHNYSYDNNPNIQLLEINIVVSDD